MLLNTRGEIQGKDLRIEATNYWPKSVKKEKRRLLRYPTGKEMGKSRLFRESITGRDDAKGLGGKTGQLKAGRLANGVKGGGLARASGAVRGKILRKRRGEKRERANHTVSEATGGKRKEAWDSMSFGRKTKKRGG